MGDPIDIQDFNAFLSAIKQTAIVNRNLNISAETIVVENLRDILNLNEKNGLISNDSSPCDIRNEKQYLNGANSLLDQSISGLMNDFYEE